jgi:hypothetical protein
MNSARIPITIVHRGADAEAAARLHERLSRELGGERMVRFAERPLPGIHRPDTGVLLVVIGPLWAHARGVSGQRGLDDPRDPVRVQIERALHANAPLLPVLVNGAQLPLAADLPVSLRPLLLRHAVDLAPAHFDDDVSELIDRIRAEAAQPQGATGHLRTGEARDSTELINVNYALPRPARETPAVDTAEPVPAGAAPGDAALAEPAPYDEPAPPDQPAVPIYAGPIPGEPAFAGSAQEEAQHEEARISRRTATPVLVVLAVVFCLAGVTAAVVALTHRSHPAAAVRVHRSSAGKHHGSSHGKGHGSSNRHRQLTACAPSRPPSGLTPAQVVDRLYADINARDFCAAWNLGASSIKREPFGTYVAGFSNLDHDVLTIDGTNGSNPAMVDVTLQVFNKHAQPVTFTGYYNVENGKIIGGYLH